MKTSKITASQLKRLYNQNNIDCHYFDRKSMQFFGDTMSNYYVPAKTVMINSWSGDVIEFYELQRKRAVKEGLNKSAYFCIKTFTPVNGKLITNE